MPKKIIKNYFCKECDYSSSKWLGKCPICNNWNTFKEINISSKSIQNNLKNDFKLKKISEIIDLSRNKFETGIIELDRVLGGGIVAGSLILLAGEPGIGKSTLLLQMASHLEKYGKIIYNNGEESNEQIKIRNERLNILNSQIYLFQEKELDKIQQVIEYSSPIGILVDSIQTLYKLDIPGLPGSLTQIKEAANLFMNLAKKKGLFVILVGHITKDGNIAGPKTLEHMVDVVLYLEGGRDNSFRTLRSYKNRFGSTHEIGIFEMSRKGLIQIINPSEYLIRDYNYKYPGTVLSAIYEGSRPLFIEVQALVTKTHFMHPKRMVDGTDLNKVYKLIAILEKTLELKLVDQDVYVNITGDLKARESAMELAIFVAIYSSFKQKNFNNSILFLGEVGLTGEIRGIPYVKIIVNEAFKLGIKKIVLPKKNAIKFKSNELFNNIISLSNVQELVSYFKLLS